MATTRMEIDMNLKKFFFVKLLVLLLVLFLIGPAFSQARDGKRIVYAGIIDWVSQDFKYIGINDHKLPITPQTKVLDEKGNRLATSELRQGRPIVVELIRNPDRSAEIRIVIGK